jgi:hypothetical protein
MIVCKISFQKFKERKKLMYLKICLEQECHTVLILKVTQELKVRLFLRIKTTGFKLIFFLNTNKMKNSNFLERQ